MVNFSKNEACPTSEELLEFQTGDLAKYRCAEVRSHLHYCEFCAAEAEFYSRHPQLNGEEVPEAIPEAIPAPLLELAESLLKIKHEDRASLECLIN
jgi:hypothetical protein